MIILANKFKDNKFAGTFLLSENVEEKDLKTELAKIKDILFEEEYEVNENISKMSNCFIALSLHTNEYINVIVKSKENIISELEILLN